MKRDRYLAIILNVGLLCSTVVALSAQDSTAFSGVVDTLSYDQQYGREEVALLSTAGEAIRNAPGIFLRTQNAGGMQLVSAQGLNPQHLQVLWNDIPVSSGMLGVSDLSLFTVGYRQDVSYTSSRLEAATGGIAGVVNVQALPLQKKGYRVSYRQSVGSFGQLLSSLDHQGAVEAHSWSVNIAYEKATNNFRYTDYTVLPNIERQQIHGSFKRFSIYPRWEWRLKKGGTINWYNELILNQREIPPSMVSPNFTADQDDQVARQMLKWQLRRANISHELNVVYVYNSLYYNDLVLKKEQTNREHLGYFRYKGDWQLAKSWQLFYGSDIKYTQVSTPNYRNGATESGWDAHTGVHFQPSLYFRTSVLAKLSVRSKLGWNIPFSIEVSGRPGKKHPVKLWVRAGIDTRYPTLNDRYWLPGGNTQLTPERSKGAAAGASWAHLFRRNFYWKHQAELFTTYITDMIVWLPTNKFYWTPENIGKVLAYGATYEQELEWSKLKHRIQVKGTYSFNRSGKTEKTSLNDKTKGKQLPYFPLHSFKWSGGYSWSGISLDADIQSYSKRFVTRDGGQSVDPYTIVNTTLGYKWTFRTWSLDGRFSVNNILDAYYEEVVYRPMPGRNYLFTLIITWKNEKS